MTTNQIITIARNKLLETTTEIISDATILLYANLSQQDIYKRTFPNSEILSATVTFSNGTATNTPTDFGTLYGSPIDTSNNTYEEISISDFASTNAGRAVTYEGGVLKVFPTTIASLAIKYYPTYPDLTSAQNPTIDSYFHELIVYGILQRAFEDLQDESLASFYMAKYESELSKKIKAQSNYEENNQRGGSLFTQQRLVTDGTGFAGWSGSPNLL